MKKVAVKINTKETEFEMLARLVSTGFERLEAKMDKKFDTVDARFDTVDARLDKHDSQFFSVHETLKDHTRRLESIERKQNGLLTSLDEATHKNEFQNLTKRVSLLEKKN